MATSPEYPDLQWLPPKSFSSGRPDHQCDATGLFYRGGARFITVHYTAGAEGYDDAEGGALYDQRRTDGTSSHFYIDADSVVQCVRTTDRSHTALRHGNLWGLHYELCGTAQTRAQWLDVVSRATIRKAARQMARDMQKYEIPLVRLTGRQLRDPAAKGICGHVDWTNGWPEDGGTHTDPGTAFPWDVLFDDIREFLAGTQEDDMDQDTPITQALDVTIDGIPGGTITRPLRWWLSALYAHQLAGNKSDAERDTALTAALAAIPGADPAVWAEQVAALLLPHLPPDDPGAFIDALRDQLAK
jgi:hypothetical protein